MSRPVHESFDKKVVQQPDKKSVFSIINVVSKLRKAAQIDLNTCVDKLAAV